ncbi:MAG: CYTH domain-containing protein [Pseudomonadota bacterium]
MFLEIELKLSINPDPAHVALLFNHPLLIQSNPITEHLVSRYFDTPDLRLWHQGLSLRIREAEGRTIQTLKTAGEQLGDLHHRYEWDQPIDTTLPTIHAFEDKKVSKKLATLIEKQPLIELFHTRFNRTQWNLHPETNTQLELVLDQGSVNTDRHQMPLHEIELELKQGDVNQIDKIAQRLKQTIPLTLETRSKAQRGYFLYIDNNLSATTASEA